MLRANGATSPRGALEPKSNLADLNVVAETERLNVFDDTAVDERAVRAAEILDVPGSPAVREDRMLAGHVGVVDDDGVVHVTSEHGHRVEGEHRPDDRLRERVEASRLSNVDCAVADIYSLSYPADSSDAVVAANVLHLVPDVAGALAALRFVLRPGGKFIALTFCHDETFLARFTSHLIALTGFPGQRRLSARSLRVAVEAAGLTVLRQETVPGWIPISFVEGHFG